MLKSSMVLPPCCDGADRGGERCPIGPSSLSVRVCHRGVSYKAVGARDVCEALLALLADLIAPASARCSEGGTFC